MTFMNNIKRTVSSLFPFFFTVFFHPLFSITIWIKQFYWMKFLPFYIFLFLIVFSILFSFVTLNFLPVLPFPSPSGIYFYSLLFIQVNNAYLTIIYMFSFYFAISSFNIQWQIYKIKMWISFSNFETHWNIFNYYSMGMCWEGITNYMGREAIYSKHSCARKAFHLQSI